MNWETGLLSPLISDFNSDFIHVHLGRHDIGPDLTKSVMWIKERKPEKTGQNLIKLKSYWQLLIESKQIQVFLYIP